MILTNVWTFYYIMEDELEYAQHCTKKIHLKFEYKLGLFSDTRDTEIAALKARISTLEQDLSFEKESHKAGLDAVKAAMMHDLRKLRETHLAELARVAKEYDTDLDAKRAEVMQFKEGVLGDRGDLVGKVQEQNKLLREENALQAAHLLALQDKLVLLPLSRLLDDQSERCF